MLIVQGYKIVHFPKKKLVKNVVKMNISKISLPWSLPLFLKLENIGITPA